MALDLKVSFKVKEKVVYVTCFQWSSVAWWRVRRQTVCTLDACRSGSTFRDDIVYRSDDSTDPSCTCSRKHIWSAPVPQTSPPFYAFGQKSQHKTSSKNIVKSYDIAKCPFTQKHHVDYFTASKLWWNG